MTPAIPVRVAQMTTANYSLSDNRRTRRRLRSNRYAKRPGRMERYVRRCCGYVGPF